MLAAVEENTGLVFFEITAPVKGVLSPETCWDFSSDLMSCAIKTYWITVTFVTKMEIKSPNH